MCYAATAPGFHGSDWTQLASFLTSLRAHTYFVSYTVTPLPLKKYTMNIYNKYTMFPVSSMSQCLLVQHVNFGVTSDIATVNDFK